MENSFAGGTGGTGGPDARTQIFAQKRVFKGPALGVLKASTVIDLTTSDDEEKQRASITKEPSIAGHHEQKKPASNVKAPSAPSSSGTPDWLELSSSVSSSATASSSLSLATSSSAEGTPSSRGSGSGSGSGSGASNKITIAKTATAAAGLEGEKKLPPAKRPAPLKNKLSVETLLCKGVAPTMSGSSSALEEQNDFEDEEEEDEEEGEGEKKHVHPDVPAITNIHKVPFPKLDDIKPSMLPVVVDVRDLIRDTHNGNLPFEFIPYGCSDCDDQSNECTDSDVAESDVEGDIKKPGHEEDDDDEEEEYEYADDDDFDDPDDTPKRLEMAKSGAFTSDFNGPITPTVPLADSEVAKKGSMHILCEAVDISDLSEIELSKPLAIPSSSKKISNFEHSFVDVGTEEVAPKKQTKSRIVRKSTDAYDSDDSFIDNNCDDENGDEFITPVRSGYYMTVGPVLTVKVPSDAQCTPSFQEFQNSMAIAEAEIRSKKNYRVPNAPLEMTEFLKQTNAGSRKRQQHPRQRTTSVSRSPSRSPSRGSSPAPSVSAKKSLLGADLVQMNKPPAKKVAKAQAAKPDASKKVTESIVLDGNDSFEEEKPKPKIARPSFSSKKSDSDDFEDTEKPDTQKKTKITKDELTIVSHIKPLCASDIASIRLGERYDSYGDEANHESYLLGRRFTVEVAVLADQVLLESGKLFSHELKTNLIGELVYFACKHGLFPSSSVLSEVQDKFFSFYQGNLAKELLDSELLYSIFYKNIKDFVAQMYNKLLRESQVTRDLVSSLASLQPPKQKPSAVANTSLEATTTAANITSPKAGQSVRYTVRFDSDKKETIHRYAVAKRREFQFTQWIKAKIEKREIPEETPYKITGPGTQAHTYWPCYRNFRLALVEEIVGMFPPGYLHARDVKALVPAGDTSRHRAPSSLDAKGNNVSVSNLITNENIKTSNKDLNFNLNSSDNSNSSANSNKLITSASDSNTSLNVVSE